MCRGALAPAAGGAICSAASHHTAPPHSCSTFPLRLLSALCSCSELIAEEAEFGDHDSSWKAVTYAAEEDLFESVSAYFDAQDRMEQAARHIHAARRAANRLRTN